MSRKKKKRDHGDVQLNLAAMLDMAFQLLTFFILTFKPPPAEVQINLRLPPPQAVKVTSTSANVRPGADESNKDPIKTVTTLVISVFADPRGNIAGLGVGEQPLNSLGSLEGKLQQVFADPSNPFEQIIVQVGSDLRYSELAKVIDVCVRQKFADGSPVTKLSFVEAPSGG